MRPTRITRDYLPQAEGSCLIEMGNTHVVCTASIANGTSSTLTHRAADVALKQRRPLLLCVRESPYNLVHLENMVRAARAGATIFPVTILPYNRPVSTSDVIEQFVGRMMDLLGLDPPNLPRWKGLGT